jgi:hypothetical protein
VSAFGGNYRLGRGAGYFRVGVGVGWLLVRAAGCGHG